MSRCGVEWGGVLGWVASSFTDLAPRAVVGSGPALRTNPPTLTLFISMSFCCLTLWRGAHVKLLRVQGAGHRAQGVFSPPVPGTVIAAVAVGPHSQAHSCWELARVSGLPTTSTPLVFIFFIETERIHSAGCRARGAMRLLGVLVGFGQCGEVLRQCIGTRCSPGPPTSPTSQRAPPRPPPPTFALAYIFRFCAGDVM